MSQIADFDTKTPFASHGNYSNEAVALMRALRDLRGESGSIESSPEQVLAALRSMGYRRQDSSFMSDAAEAKLFGLAMQRFAKQNNVSYPTCDDVINVVQELGYRNAKSQVSAVDGGLPIDRRRLEFDTRMDSTERRASDELSPQEMLDLTDEEHLFLDALKELRERTGRGFASSEEILSIAWRMGYRPRIAGQVANWLNETQRCELQMSFSTAIETQIRQSNGEFLTCRDLLKVIHDVGFQPV